MKNLWLKWTILVWLNAFLGLCFSTDKYWQSVATMLGINVGICFFIPIYVQLDKWARKNPDPMVAYVLWFSVIARMITQVFLWVDLLAGYMAVELLKEILGNIDFSNRDIGFIKALLLTIITGGILSTLVAMLGGSILIILKLRKLYSLKKITKR